MNETTVTFIFLFLLGTCILNFAVATIARIKTKNKAFNALLYYWPTVIFTFICAGQLRHSPTEIAFAYFLQIFSSNMFANFLIFNMNLKVKWKFHIGLQLATMVLTTFLLLQTDLGFTYSLLPLCIVYSLVFLKPIKAALFDKNIESNWIEKSMAVVYITAIGHHFNMAFFRLDPNAEAWGWAVTIAEYQCMAIFLPLLINHKREHTERKNLKQAVEKITGPQPAQVMESRTEELYKQLEFLIAQKESLYNELQNSNNHLEEEREMNEILIRTISHDLANPLTVIGAYIEMLHTGKIPEADSEKIWNRVKSNTQSALDMIGRIRNAILTRTQASLVAVHDVSIDRSMKRVADMFETRLKEKNIKLVYNNKTSLDTFVAAEENALTEHIFANVLSNAIKFSYPGSEIQINVTNFAEGVQVEFRDFGTGIQVSRLEKRLLMSTQGTNGETGTGFGLMVMGYFLRQFGATIEMSSKTEGPSRGTSVTIKLKKSLNSQGMLLKSADTNANYLS